MNRQRKKYYQISWKKSAVKFTKKLPKQIKTTIIEETEELSNNPQGKEYPSLC